MNLTDSFLSISYLYSLTGSYYFRRWQANECWAQLNKGLVEQDRRQSAPAGQSSPSVAVVDAQSIKCSERGVLDKGFDGHKKNLGPPVPTRRRYGWPAAGRPGGTGQ